MASRAKIDMFFLLVIIGASSGIGTGTAKLFSQLGAKLALTGRNEENLKKTAEECIALGDCQVQTLFYLS